MTKTANSLAEKLELRVIYTDGREVDYTTAPVDVWRVEQFLGIPSSQMTGMFTAIAYMAYSVSLRRGESYRPRKASTDRKVLFEQWLEDVDDVAVLTDDEASDETDPKGDAPGSPTSPAPGSLDESQ